MQPARPYQVFVGCPFRKAIRKNYDRLQRELEAETPLQVVLADTGSATSTDYLLELITRLITESGCCIFDATGGNPNVSLEVGIAHALPADFLLTVNTRKRRTRQESEAEKAATREGEVRAIIADLQGKVRIEYKSYPALKAQVVKRYIRSMPYIARWAEFQKAHSSFVSPALALFEDLRKSGRTLRPRVAAKLEGTGLDVDDLLRALTGVRLIEVRRGRQGGIYYPKK